MRKMFIAQVGMIVCSVLAVVPLVSILATIGVIVFAVLSLVGLYKAGKEIKSCKAAFILTILGLVIGMLNFEGTMGLAINIVGEVVDLAVIYLVCTSVAKVMREIPADKVANKGILVWRINLGCTLASILFGILVYVPSASVFAWVAVIVVYIITLVGSILYMLFLKDSAAELGSY